jgi:hypothetical protein
MKLWIAATRMKKKDIGKNTVICSKHFDEVDFLKNGKRVQLNTIAVPSLLLNVRNQSYFMQAIRI